jgi:hypothetical protein
MSFIKIYPFRKEYIDVASTNAPEKQLWQELVAIRFLHKPKNIHASKATAPWIDQAKIYFTDACKSDWRSSGLLYYYSFLNLAKAYLAAKRSASAKVLKSTSSYHGLSVDPQAPRKITDFELRIHPPVFKGKHNVFAKFYEIFMGAKWPHTQEITVKLSDVLPYCRELTTEISNFYGIETYIIYAYSLLRDNGSAAWFEMLVSADKQAIIQGQVTRMQLSSINAASFNHADKSDWLTAYGLTMQDLRGSVFLRSPAAAYNTQNKGSITTQVKKTVLDSFGDYALPTPTSSSTSEFWQFIPKINMGGSQIMWHPFLSDYLIAFVLSTILRYHPHLLKPNSQDSYLAEAWCAQSAITALRYYLMSLTAPSIRCN